MQLHFIIGIGRSGTTILNKLLNNYKQIHCLPEANFLVFCLHQFKDKTIFSEKEIELLFEEIELYACSHPWVGWQFDLKKTKTTIIQQLHFTNEMNYEMLCKLIYQEFKVVGADKLSAEMLIDKNPSYTIYTNEIIKTFPNSKFIWIVRDYRANVLSRKQSVFLKSPNVAYNAIRWKLYNKRALAFSQRFPDKVLKIRYEDLVLNTEVVTEKIEQFLDLKKEFESEYFSKQQTINLSQFPIAEKYKERFVKKYSDLNHPLNTTRIDAWKEKLSHKEIMYCDIICSHVAEEIGYSVHTKNLILKKIINRLVILPGVFFGYLDLIKDKILYYLPISVKLNRLRKKYTQLGFIAK